MTLPTAGGPPHPYLQGVGEVAWSSDGRQVAYHGTGPGDPIFVAPAAGGAARRIYAAVAGVHCHFQVWSRDDAFIYFTQGVPGDHWDLWRIRPSGADPERLTFHNSLVTHPVVLGEHTLLYLATDAQGGGPWLYGIDVRRRVPHRLSFGLERYTSLAASADGTRLAVTVVRPTSGLWRLPFSSALVTAATPLSADSPTGLSPRNGSGSVLYVSRAAGRPGVWKLANGASRELWVGSAAAPPCSPTHSRCVATRPGRRTASRSSSLRCTTVSRA